MRPRRVGSRWKILLPCSDNKGSGKAVADVMTREHEEVADTEMMYVQPHELRPGMILAQDLLGARDEVLLRRGQVLTPSQVEKLGAIDHKNACIVDCGEESEEDPGLISRRLKRNAVNAVHALFEHIEKGNREEQANALMKVRGFLDEMIDEISADRTMVIGLADIKAYDEYTYYHSVSVATLSILLGVSAGMSRNALYRLGMGALLHDVGKVFISKQIIQKPGPLNDEEYEKVKGHSMLGYNYLRESWGGPPESTIAVLTHHERYNGSGYPLGLSGDKQPLEARIIALSDVYDAMTSERPYRSAIPPSEAIEHIMGNSGTMFDPQLVSVFMKKIMPYPIGSRVRLSNGHKAVVVGNHVDSLMRPKVKLLHFDAQKAYVDDRVMDLRNDSAHWNVTILGLDIPPTEGDSFDQCFDC